jgi:phytoene dehydrogenase-like protein
MSEYDAVVVGSGPNGLAAAVTLAAAGRSVLVIEGSDVLGGGCRTAELTLPGYLHDLCSAIHPLALASPCLRELPLADHGLEWVTPPAACAHPLDDGRAVMLEHSIGETAESLGADADPYRRLMEPVVRDWPRIERTLLGPAALPSGGLLGLSRFGLRALRSARSLAESRFSGEPAKALMAGLAAHTVLPLEATATAAVTLVLGLLGHRVGWPFPRGGAARIAEALASYLTELGGRLETGRWVRDLDELPSSRAVLLDVTPRQLLAIAGDRLPERYRRSLSRFRYGPGVFKLDLALDGPIPWRAEGCARSATVHLGGTMTEIAAAEAAVWKGEHPERPFVLLAQQSLFDETRAPAGHHTVWAYCHVPHGSTLDMTAAIEGQIERFAPGFRDRVLARSARDTRALESDNPNLVGGDLAGGVTDLGQLWTRPTARWVPYSTPLRGLYLCSSSTPPGGGVHGMCGFHAARAVLARELRD